MVDMPPNQTSIFWKLFDTHDDYVAKPLGMAEGDREFLGLERREIPAAIVLRKPLHYHRSHVHSGPEWLHLIESYQWVK